MVTGSEPIRLACVGLHESYGLCKHGEHERTTTPVNSQHCKKYQQRCSGLLRLQVLWSHKSQNASTQMEGTSNNLLELTGESVTVCLTTWLNKSTMPPLPF